MGRRRNTAKTGKTVSNSRSSLRSEQDDRGVTTENFLRLEESRDDASSQERSVENIPMKHDVMDLGMGGSDSSDDIDSSEDEDKLVANPQDDAVHSDDDASLGSNSEEEMDQLSNPRHWGGKKSFYYHGDTGDIEIGQDEEDAFDEEAAAKEVELSRFQEMDEADFMLPAEDDTDGLAVQPRFKDSHENVASEPDVSKLSGKEKRKFLKKRHPEILTLATFFSDVCKELRYTTQVATTILAESKQARESVGASSEGQQYLLTRYLLESSTLLNASLYLLLKSGDSEIGVDELVGDRSGCNIDAHPVMAQIQKCNKSNQRFKEKVARRVGNIDEQVDYLVKAAALMTSPNQGSEEDSDISIVASEENPSADRLPSRIETSVLTDDQPFDEVANIDTQKERDGYLRQEARFGLRASEVIPKKKEGKRKLKSINSIYFGDLEMEARGGRKLLASTINSIEQRSKKRQETTLVEEIDETETNGEPPQGLRRIEEELFKVENGIAQADNNVLRLAGDNNDELASTEKAEVEATRFYNVISGRRADKKMMKKRRYEVAPKFPVADTEVSGERAVGRAIMKNRGLVAHKAKTNRNPRVKKREQYRKALIRRKGAVREIRTDEGHKYGGEETGIKSAISRSRKL
eukprot:scaffold7328_cov145-Cylindrotheca_fusiformis.AAC.5